MKKIIIPGIVAGVVLLVVSMGISAIFNALFPQINQEYMNPSIFRPWSDPLMTLYFAYPFLLGLVLAIVWDKAKSVVSGKTYVDKGFQFGLLYFIAAGIPGMFITYSSFQVSLLMVINWSIAGFIEAVVAGIILAKMNSRS